MLAASWSWTSWGRESCSGVRIQAGPTALTRMPLSPYSAAAFLVKPTMACFEAAYAEFSKIATAPWMEAMFTIAVCAGLSCLRNCAIW